MTVSNMTVACLAAAWLALAATPAARAQSVPATALPQGSPLPAVVPRAAPNVHPSPLIPAPPASANAAPATPVAIRRVAIEGATVFRHAVLSRLVGRIIGPAVPLTRVEAARLAVLQHYRAHGYVLTTVTAIIEADHTLRLRITEGRIAEVKLDGDIGPAGTQVLRFLNQLTKPKAINTATLERYLLLAQEVPGVTVRAVLRPSTDQPGALTLIAQVNRRPVGGIFSADNRAFNRAGPEEGLVVLDLNSFTQFGERTELSLYRTFNATQIFGQASTEVFLGSSGLRAKIYGGAGDATPSGDLRAAGYDGRTTVFGGQLSYPIIRSRLQTLNVTGAFDAIQSTVYEGPSNASSEFSSDSLRILRLGAEYARSDIWLGGERAAVNTLALRVSRGLEGLGGSRNGTTTAPRQGERINFFKADLDLSRTQTLFAPWRGASVALMGVLSGQITPDLLPPSEQYFLGGNRLDRGYYSGQVTGDNALASTVELQLNTPTNFSLLGYDVEASAQFYGFYDWGETWQNRKVDPNHHLQSFGLGVRMSLTRYTEIDLEGVRRLTIYPTGASTGVSALPTTAFYWRVLARF
ncbi:MAG: BamA/TamA family outer membrane protein [Rhodospirillales bacterium]|nr:BamA/TamA family outer membrane protein [Rhodospirillales bacterium]